MRLRIEWRIEGRACVVRCAPQKNTVPTKDKKGVFFVCSPLNEGRNDGQESSMQKMHTDSPLRLAGFYSLGELVFLAVRNAEKRPPPMIDDDL
ncbi:MAG: hypothetical protein Q9M28_06805 [Mariprofundaceae bacterium]|nr:hypothetical protein [Mariprofundaceae bacterium]